MTRPRHPRRDSNQRQITRDLERCGFDVFDISSLPDAKCPGDILVAGWLADIRAYAWQPFEIKTEDGELTDRQRRFREEHPEAEIPVVRCAEDVLRWFGRLPLEGSE